MAEPLASSVLSVRTISVTPDICHPSASREPVVDALGHRGDLLGDRLEPLVVVDAEMGVSMVHHSR